MKLGPTDLDYLDRLVERGEGLLMKGLQFSQAEALLREQLAQVVETYGDDIQRIEPTDAGRRLAELREQMRLERMAKMNAQYQFPVVTFGGVAVGPIDTTPELPQNNHVPPKLIIKSKLPCTCADINYCAEQHVFKRNIYCRQRRQQ